MKWNQNENEMMIKIMKANENLIMNYKNEKT